MATVASALDRIKQDIHPFLSAYPYQVTDASGTTTYGYDDLNRLTSETQVEGTTTLFSESFILNDDGTRASSEETQLQSDNSSIVTTDTSWTYDAMQRLTGDNITSSVSGESYSDIFAYDLNSNRISEAHTGPGDGADENITYVYNGNDELTSQTSSINGDTTFAYDANGSQTTSTHGSDVTTYNYDVRNKMVGFSDGTTTASYVYDDAGNRVKETVNGTTTYYLTDTQNPTGYAQPIEERSSPTAAPTMTYILGDHVEAQVNTSGTVSYLLTDGHGSTQQLTDASGNVTATFRYDAFGGAINFTLATAPTMFLFGGDAVYDPASGLYMHGDGVRDRMGFRFIQADTQGNGSNGDPISLHKYLYADGDPVNGSDPSGHFGLIELLLVTGGRFSFGVANFATSYAPAIGAATTIAGAVFLVSSVELALEQNGFLPQNDYTPYVVAVSGLIFSAGQSLQAIGQQTAQITSPLRNSNNGKIISGDAANAASGTTLPPYAPASLAAEGTIAPGTQLVRFYASPSLPVGQFCVEESEVEGLTAAQIQAKLALPALPTRVVNVDATGQAARTGIVGPNFGQPGGGPQVQLLPPYGAKFFNDRPLPASGL